MSDANPTALGFLANPWKNNNNSIWLGSTLTLYRNLEKYKFPHKAGLDRRQQLIPLITHQVTLQAPESNFHQKNAEELEPTDKELLFEQFLTLESLHQAHLGEAFLLSPAGNLLVAINLQNHVMFHLLDCSGELEKGLTMLTKLEASVGDTLSFAFSPRFGFLTADPFMCGTGLVAGAFLQVPALVHSGALEAFLVKNHDDVISVNGLQGTGKGWIGDLVVVRNSYKLGVTEENIISALHLFSTKLQVAEASQRSQLMKKENPEIKDRISRAYAILMHSYQIEIVEAMNAISLLKLGLDLGWVKNSSMAELNALFFGCRRGHLINSCGIKIDQEQLPHRRAEFIHAHLKDVLLTL